MGTWLDGLDEKDYPKPSKTSELDLSEYPEGNIKQTAELLGAPYNTVRNWFTGTHQPPPWNERLIVEKIQNSV